MILLHCILLGALVGAQPRWPKSWWPGSQAGWKDSPKRLHHHKREPAIPIYPGDWGLQVDRLTIRTPLDRTTVAPPFFPVVVPPLPAGTHEVRVPHSFHWQAVANLSDFRRMLHDEMVNNAPLGHWVEGYGRFDIYPSDIVTCPPGATLPEG
jgi:hypothetical protein